MHFYTIFTSRTLRKKVSMAQQNIKVVAIEEIRMNPRQPRRLFSDVEVAELAASIKEIGLIQPPVVRIVEGGVYELVAGERRIRAMKLAGFQKTRVIVSDYDDITSQEAALIENVQRADLNAIEIAEAIFDLMKKVKFTQEQVAAKIGKRRSTVANFLRLLQLPSFVQDKIRSGEITMGHAKAILSLPENEQELYCRRILGQKLSVRDAEKGAKRQADKNALFVRELEEKLRGVLGTKVEIIGDGDQGKIQIPYYDLDDLDRILLILGASC